MGALSAITLGDVVAALRRYQPVAIGLVVLLTVFAVLPKPERVEGALDDSSALLEETRASSPAGGGAATAAPSTVTTAPAPGVGDASFTPSFGASSPGFAGSTFDAGSGSSDSASAFPSADDPVVTFDGTSIDSDTAETGAPLRIVGSTWASRQAGTPLAKEGVPEGTLPVGFRVTDDKLSFIRLAGDQTILTLAEDPAGVRETNGPIVVQLCAVTTDGWKDGEAIAIPDAPAWDAGSCVLGERDAGSGSWTFDLSSFPSAVDPKGFALVPGEGGGLDFQVAFKKG